MVDPEGTHPTTVVLFDPKMDLAVLRTTGLAGRALALQRAMPPAGQQGAALGFPGGGPVHGEPGAVREYSRMRSGGTSTAASWSPVTSISWMPRSTRELGRPVRQLEGRGVRSGLRSSLVNPKISYALTSAEVALRVGPGSCRQRRRWTPDRAPG